MQHNQDRKHRTYVYVLTVTETLEAWEDSVNIGMFTQLRLWARKVIWMCFLAISKKYGVIFDSKIRRVTIINIRITIKVL